MSTWLCCSNCGESTDGAWTGAGSNPKLKLGSKHCANCGEDAVLQGEDADAWETYTMRNWEVQEEEDRARLEEL